MSGYDILMARGVTRLCHFTKFQSLTHIVSSASGILASNSIRQDTKNVIDVARYDGELDYVCCSVQYPNSWFMKKAIQNNTDKIFKDWVVLYINLGVLKDNSAKFCPCNASTAKGAYIQNKMSDLELIFADSVTYPRSRQMLPCCPTDGQAEILIRDNIPREYIDGIAVGNEDVAKRIYATLRIYGMQHIPIYTAPDVMTSNWSAMIKSGLRPNEAQCCWSEEE
jgi:hypothetical protein